jgi:hypothetical protein
MAISNTSILIKRSLGSATPSSLKQGELGYSYQSNTLFIGTPDGTGFLAIGSNGTFETISSATSANVASTLVKRNAEGAFFGKLFGVANSAVQLDTAQNFSVTGEVLASAVSFNGTSPVALAAALSTTLASPGTYGGTTAIPVVTVAANGRIIDIANTSVTTSFTVAGDTGTPQTVNGGDTLTLAGGAGITSTASATDTVTFDVDNTVLRGNTSVGTQIVLSDVDVFGNVAITGNLIISGNVIAEDIDHLVIGDPFIYLAANNYSADILDIGWAANYFDGADNRHTGIFRHASNKEYYVFDNYLPELEANNEVNINDASFRVATLNSNLKSIVANTNVLNVSEANATNITITSALNPNYLTPGSITYYDGGKVASLANVGTSGAYGSASYIPVITTDAYGRVSAVSNTAVAINASQITDGTLPIARGGTNQTTFTPGSLTFFDGTSLASFANSTYTLTGSLAASKTISSLTVDAYGRVTAATGVDIAIDASQITSGTLGVARGGTGAGSFTAGQIIVGNGTGALSQIANVTPTITGGLSAGNTITSLTIDDYGRVTAYTGSLISGLTVSQGGTGAATFTTNGMIYGNGTGALQATAAADTSDQSWSNQILTVTNTGVPVWATNMDGGTF